MELTKMKSKDESGRRDFRRVEGLHITLILFLISLSILDRMTGRVQRSLTGREREREDQVILKYCQACFTNLCNKQNKRGTFFRKLSSKKLYTQDSSLICFLPFHRMETGTKVLFWEVGEKWEEVRKKERGRKCKEEGRKRFLRWRWGS